MKITDSKIKLFSTLFIILQPSSGTALLTSIANGLISLFQTVL